MTSPTQASRKCFADAFSAVTAGDHGHRSSAVRTKRPLGLCSEIRREVTGDTRDGTSKGADEQSSRRAPGSHVDPGVCVCAQPRVDALCFAIFVVVTAALAG